MMQTRNAVIRDVSLGKEDHGIMTCLLYLDYGGSSQTFGGYALDTFDKAKNKRIGTAWGMEFIRRVLETIEVNSWESLAGEHCRVISDDGNIYKIGHIIKEKWFDPKFDLKSLESSET